MLAYFVTVFVAAPLALITGSGMSPALSTRMRAVSRVLSIQVARSLHYSEEIAGGYGGYNADHEFFGYIHTI